MSVFWKKSVVLAVLVVAVIALTVVGSASLFFAISIFQSSLWISIILIALAGIAFEIGIVICFKILEHFGDGLPTQRHKDRVAVCVDRNVKVNGKFYSKYIQTNLDDVDFLISVLQEWAQYPQHDLDILIESELLGDRLTDNYLTLYGFELNEISYALVGENVKLTKFGVGMWVADNLSSKELDEFAESIKGNIDF